MLSEKRSSMLHGVLLIALFSCAAFYIGGMEFVKKLSFSPMIVGIILGMLYANSLRNYIPDTWVPGIKILYQTNIAHGYRTIRFPPYLSTSSRNRTAGNYHDVIVIGITLLLGVIAGRLLKMDEKTTVMVSTGSAICGAAAVLGAEPVVKCAPHKTAIAVSTVVIFGTLSMFLYPILYRTGILDLSLQEMAIYTGSTLHEVAHVVGAGNAMDPEGALHLADQATITKMIRVMMLAPVLLIMSYIIARVRKARHTDVSSDGKSKISVPWFAFGFLLVIAINSLLQSFSFIPSDIMSTGINAINSFDNFLLTMAMTALGAETSIDKFKQAGAKPFYLAGIIYLWLIFGGYALCKYLVPVLA